MICQSADKGKTKPKSNPHTGAAAVVVFTEKADQSKELLGHLVQTLQHTGDQIAAHEYLAQFVIILVFKAPNEVVLGIEFRPEVGNRNGLIRVAVTAFKIIKIGDTLWHGIEGML